jgi:hypothetical protein
MTPPIADVSPNPEPLDRGEFDAATLMRQHPPVLRNPNKLVAFRVACPDGTAGGHLSYSRWAEMPLSATADPGRAATLVAVRDDFYDYEPPTEPAPEWHVNFADPRLFYAYGSPLFAQDEMQVAEHPALGSLREALVAERRSTLTVEDGRPRPVPRNRIERIVHTGFWGCGAFGGNRVMMTLLQALAAEMAGVGDLVMHVGEVSGRTPVDQAGVLLRDVLAEPEPDGTAALIGRIESLGLEWGHSDGN